MGLVRINNCPYYYRNERAYEGNRRYFVGSGVLARLAGETDALIAERRETRRMLLRQTAVELGSRNNVATKLARRAELLARAKLIVSGWYIHRKCEWRRRG